MIIRAAGEPAIFGYGCAALQAGNDPSCLAVARPFAGRGSVGLACERAG
jgi:hypothetical protein